jgi:mycothiol synthase
MRERKPERGKIRSDIPGSRELKKMVRYDLLVLVIFRAMSSTGALSWRPIEARDVPACTVLLAAIEETDQTGDVFGEEDLLETFRDPGRDYPRGSTCVHDGDVMVGYCCLAAGGSADQVHQMSQYGGVHPAYRGQGIGGRLLDWAELAAVPLHEERYPGLPLSISGWCSAGNSGESALYASRGFQPARWFHLMAADLTTAGPSAPVPAGVQVVPFTAERAEDARLVRNEAFRDHWQPDQVTPGEWAHFLSYNAFRPVFSYLAYDGSEPLGVLISREYDAYTELTGILDLYIAEVATRRSARNRGIASALLSRALADARSAGFTAASLTVNADSPAGAFGLYQRAGFAIRTTSVMQVKNLGIR